MAYYAASPKGRHSPGKHVAPVRPWPEGMAQATPNYGASGQIGIDARRGRVDIGDPSVTPNRPADRKHTSQLIFFKLLLTRVFPLANERNNHHDSRES